MIEAMRERVVAACDGASKGNPGPAGWAWVVSDDSATPARWEAGPLGTANNNSAELTALGSPLAAPRPGGPRHAPTGFQLSLEAGAPRRKPAAGKQRGGASSRTIKAKFPGRCLCGRSYGAGEPIAKNGQGWGHPECRTAEAG